MFLNSLRNKRFLESFIKSKNTQRLYLTAKPTVSPHATVYHPSMDLHGGILGPPGPCSTAGQAPCWARQRVLANLKLLKTMRLTEYFRREKRHLIATLAAKGLLGQDGLNLVHDQVRPFHQTSSLLTQSILGPNVVQIRKEIHDTSALTRRCPHSSSRA